MRWWIYHGSVVVKCLIKAIPGIRIDDFLVRKARAAFSETGSEIRECRGVASFLAHVSIRSTAVVEEDGNQAVRG